MRELPGSRASDGSYEEGHCACIRPKTTPIFSKSNHLLAVPYMVGFIRQKFSSGTTQERTDKLYLHNTEKKNYQEAKAFCESKGAALLAMQNAERRTQNAVKILFKNSSIWLDLLRYGVSKEFVWTPTWTPTGIRTALGRDTYWASEQPYKPQDCAIASGNNMEWIEISCDSKAEVVCEKLKTGKQSRLFFGDLG